MSGASSEGVAYAAVWQSETVTEPISHAEPSGWLTFGEVAERLGVPEGKVKQYAREGQLLAVRREGQWRVPAELVANRTVLRHLPGVLTLLYDAGYSAEEALHWLYEPDDSLPGTPAVALGSNNATEVKRRAQAVGF